MAFCNYSGLYTFYVLIGLLKSIFHNNNLLYALVFVRRELVFVIIGLVLLELYMLMQELKKPKEVRA